MVPTPADGPSRRPIDSFHQCIRCRSQLAGWLRSRQGPVRTAGTCKSRSIDPANGTRNNCYKGMPQRNRFDEWQPFDWIHIDVSVTSGHGEMDHGNDRCRVACRDPPGAEARPLDEVQELAYETYDRAEAEAWWAYETAGEAYGTVYREAEETYLWAIGEASVAYGDAYSVLEETGRSVLTQLTCPFIHVCCAAIDYGAAESDVREWSDTELRDRDAGFVATTGISVGGNDFMIGGWVSLAGTCPPHDLPPRPV